MEDDGIAGGSSPHGLAVGIEMIGAIAGDMIASPYEHSRIKHKDFQVRVAGSTDDTLLTIAVAQAKGILVCQPNTGDIPNPFFALPADERGLVFVFPPALTTWTFSHFQASQVGS